jgi:hypothetical protein
MMTLAEAVPFGHENAVSRSELALRTGMSDRGLRDAINKSEVLILNLQDGKGYFQPLPEESSLVEAWIALFSSRIKEEKKRIRQARKWTGYRQTSLF